MTRAVKMDLAALYVPYLVLGECCEFFHAFFVFRWGIWVSRMGGWMGELKGGEGVEGGV